VIEAPVRTNGQTLAAHWLGRVAYAEGLRLQEALVAGRRRGTRPDTLLLLEHPPVVTLGRTADPNHVLLDRATLRARGIELFETGRGGDVTYHGLGQLIGYPIVALPEGRRDAHRYLRDLEESIIRTVGEFGVKARRVPSLTGVWVGDRKIAAIGVRISRGWVTSHGFALNVAAELAGFDAIVPCGIRDRGLTSLEELTGRSLGLREVAVRVARRLAQVLGARMNPPAVIDSSPSLVALEETA
jgi:lipoyl(octanoyl) transferase